LGNHPRAKLTRLVTFGWSIVPEVAAGHDCPRRRELPSSLPAGKPGLCPSPAGWAPVTSALQSCEGWGLLSLGIFQETERLLKSEKRAHHLVQVRACLFAERSRQPGFGTSPFHRNSSGC